VVAPIITPTDDPSAVIVFGAATASFVLVGLLLVRRAAGNRIGPLLVLAGVLLSAAYGLSAYTAAGAAASPSWPGVALASVVGDALFLYPIVIALIVIPLIFPDGHLISRSWRPIAWLIVAAVAAQTFASLVSPTSSGIEGFDNPLAIPGIEPMTSVLAGLSSATSIIGFGAAAAALWVRYRRGSPIERQQLKWLVGVALLAAIFFPVAFIVPIREVADASFILGALTLVALPLAIAVAITRYHLFEIDRIISRTIGWALVTGLLAAVFTVGLLVLQALLTDFTQGQTLAVAASTLVAFALFQPVRRRVQHGVDRRFDRARYDGERTAAAFAERLRDQVDLAELESDVLRIVGVALRPRASGIWLRSTSRDSSRPTGP
jgi:drug/metabolite transporter (DMT)-like permease